MLKSTHVFLKNLLKPKKSNNTLFLYQRTIAVSLWIIIILGVASIGIEVVNSSNHWIIFIQNGMVGIACSAVVVVVTVYLQFKTEQGKNIETHNKCLYQLLTCINDCLFLTDFTRKEEKFLLDSVNEEIYNYFRSANNICWYDSKKSTKFYDILIKVLPLVAPIIRKDPIRTLIEYRNEITLEKYNLAVEAARIFAQDFLATDERNRFESLKHTQLRDSMPNS